MNYLANAAQILVQFFFDLLIGVVVARVLLQLVRANFYNPICQFLYKYTNPILMPLRRVIPGWRNLDVAGVLLVYLLEVIKVVVLGALAGASLSLPGTLVWALAELIEYVLMAYFWLILIRALLSFVGADTRSPVIPLIYQITEPVLKPLRNRLPPLGGFDFSPLIATLAIYLARALIVQPLFDAAARLV